MATMIGQVGYAIRQGSKMYNEDAVQAVTLLGQHSTAPAYVHLLIVADGHGYDGHGKLCADFCVAAATNWMKGFLSVEMNWETFDWKFAATGLTEQMHETFREVLCNAAPNRTIVEPYNVVCATDGFREAIHSGSTFSMTITFPVGDKFRTIPIQVGDSDIYINGVRVNCDHTPLNVEEYRRIQKLPEEIRGSLLFDTKGLNDHIFMEDGNYNPKFYNPMWPRAPWRWSKELTPNCAKYTPGTYLVSSNLYPTKLACTRSIGDFYAHVHGVTHEPYVGDAIDTETCPHITVASDGAFDTIDANDQWVFLNKRVFPVHISIDEQNSVMDVVTERVDILYELYVEKFGAKHVDDISMCVLHP